MDAKKRAAIAMSGGVDSTVAAYLTQQAGFDCLGTTMRRFPEEWGLSEEAQDARNAAQALGMPFYEIDLTSQFQAAVTERFTRAYEQGLTPNPCIDCNRFLKFGELYGQAQALGCEYLVTGHYARILPGENGRWQLLKGLDETKDQSYVLYCLTQEQLAHTILPLGDRRKDDIRKIAEAQGFLNAQKKDSQDICFIPDGDYAGFIQQQTRKTYAKGNFVDEQGRILGQHQGLIHYTVGQRRGLGVSGGKPLYVKELRPWDNTVVLADNAALFRSVALAADFNWVSIPAPAGEIPVKARCRYHQKEQAAVARCLPDGTVQVRFVQPQRAITPGQALVLYDGDTVLGGGTIVSAAD